MSKKELSILMPAYNNTCVLLVRELAEQCSNIEGLRYEILVADDGSTNKRAVMTNREINGIEYCRYIERGFNAGRAAIRNFLAQTARYANVIFMDSDVKVEKDDFIEEYLCAQCDGVVYGGIHNDEKAFDASNLRCVYERAFEVRNPASVRNTKPYKQFRTTNFMATKDIMMRFPFDEGFKGYGYEDVLFGRALMENKISILHTDNPVVIDDYDSNADFMDKTHEALHTLFAHRDEMEGYSGIISAARKAERMHATALLRSVFRICGRRMLSRLLGRKPSLMLYNLYRVLYYVSLQ